MEDYIETKVQPDSEQHKDGSFKVEKTNDGIFLSVHAPDEGGTAVAEPLVIDDLKEKNIQGFNLALVSSVIKEATGQPVKIADSMEIPEPEIQVLVDRDRMEASLTIVMAANSRKVTVDEVFEKINKSGVVCGINQDAVHQAIKYPGSRVSFAHGTRAIDGADGYMNYFFDSDKKIHPEELVDGRVDYKDLHLFTVVKEGEILAEKINPMPGTPGMDVLGQEAHAKSGKDLVIPAGKNVTVQGNNVVAAISGQFQIVNNKITVLPVIEIKGDVDFSTGNIDFVGNVIIRGSVQSGFTVRADGSVEIFGTVSGATIEGKNVIIKMGIQGMQRGHIKAKEDIVTKFIENATVLADGDVLVSDTILHSFVSAGKKVVVEGKRGLIAGGHVMASEEIRAKIVGTQMAVATDLEVGVSPSVRDEYHNLRTELKKAEITLDQAQKSIAILKNYNQCDLPPEKREMLLRLTKSQFVLSGQIETMKKRIAEIEIIFEEARFGKIKVSEAVYPGVKIVIGTLVKPIREVLKFTSFFAEGGDIKIGSFK